MSEKPLLFTKLSAGGAGLTCGEVHSHNLAKHGTTITKFSNSVDRSDTLLYDSLGRRSDLLYLYPIA